MTIIKRTYNDHGDADYLFALDGNCPTWSSRRRAMAMTADEAEEIIQLIATYRDWLCPNGIAGVEAVAA